MQRQARTLVLAATLLALTGSHGLAAGGWSASEADKTKFPPEIVKEERAPAPSGIAHMLTAPASPSGDITAAWYAQPTGRYRHGVLGDAIEGGALSAKLKDGRTVTLRLPETEVFEDIAPRVIDLDLDGRSEIVTIVSTLTGGAAIAVFGMAGDGLVKKASTPHLGKPNRWMNVAGIGRFTADRLQTIAFVATPHIGGKLGFLRYVQGSLSLIAAESGYSNHVIGSPELRLSASADIDGDGNLELALPSNDRKTLRIMGFTPNGLKEVGSAELRSAIDKAIAIEGEGEKTAFVVGLEDGSVWRVSR
jgi:hypothetical protein